MTAADTLALRMSRHFDASPEQVFDAWTDPAVVARWLFTSPTSEKHTVELDLRVGGRWSITDRRDGTDYTATGEYVTIDRPLRLAFTFGMPQFSPDMATVTVELIAEAGGTRMTMTQAPTPPEEQAPAEHGWSLMFEVLKAVLAG